MRGLGNTAARQSLLARGCVNPGRGNTGLSSGGGARWSLVCRGLRGRANQKLQKILFGYRDKTASRILDTDRDGLQHYAIENLNRLIHHGDKIDRFALIPAADSSVYVI